VTVFFAPPTVYRLLVQQNIKDYDLSRLRHCTAATEPLSADTIHLWKEATGLDIYDGYGQSESAMIISNYRFMPIKPGSIGRPMPGLTVAIHDNHGDEVPVGVKGNIAVKVKPEHPPGLFKHYWDDQINMPESFKGDWYYPQDIAWKDEDGYYWFVGRADEVFKTSGYRIGPFEVESALQEHPAVAESVVIGLPDPGRGEIVKAFVVLKPGYSGSPELIRELQEFVKHYTAPYKYPRKIEFISELPKDKNGKILRAELRKQVPEKTAV
jgi:acetyl-CoA synthetase